MSRFGAILVSATLAIALLLPAGARAEESYFASILNKAGHGLGNLALGWSELPKNVINISSDCNFLCGITFGTVRGALHAGLRTCVGGIELATFMIPSDPFVTPSYIWDRQSEDTRYWGFHVPGDWTHFGPMDDGGFGER